MQGAIGLPAAEVVRPAAVLSFDGQLAARVVVAIQQRYPPFEPAQVVESWMQAFHAAGWVQRAEIAETFEDVRYQELAHARIVFLEQPDALQPERRQMLGVWLQNRLQGREGVKVGRTVDDAPSELTDISPSEPGAQAAVSDIRT